MFKCAYAIIEKTSTRCVQTGRTNVSGWKMEDSTHFSVELPTENAHDFVDKFYHSGKWWERIYNRYETIVEKDEDGNIIYEETVPVEEYGYTETVFEV